MSDNKHIIERLKARAEAAERELQIVQAHQRIEEIREYLKTCVDPEDARDFESMLKEETARKVKLEAAQFVANKALAEDQKRRDQELEDAIWRQVDKLEYSLSYLAPEDREMRRTKMYEAMLLVIAKVEKIG